MVDYNIAVPQPYDPSGDIGNALRFRAAQQAEAENQLKLQAWKEDRAYQLKQREAAAANAASERAKAAELRDIYGNYGVTPAVTGARGMSYSGTGVANNPDETLFNNLVRGGYVSAAKNVAEARGEFSKTEVEKLNLDAKKYDDALARTKQYLPMIQNADDVARYVRMKYEDPVLGPIAAKMRPVEDAVRVTVDQFTKDPQGTLSSLAGLTGADIAKQKFEKDKQDAELAKLKAETAKFTAEAKGKGAPSAFGDTNEGRQLEIINEVARGLRSPNDPEYAIAYHAQYGGKNVAAYNPETKQMELVQAPATPPANLPPPAYGATNALPAVNGVRPAGAPSNAFVTPPAAPALTGAGRPVITAAPKEISSEREKQKIGEENKAKDAQEVLKFIGYDPATGMTDVDKLLNKSTSGRLEQLGSAALAQFGSSTEGSKAIAQLSTTASTLALQLAGGKLGAGFSNEDRDFLMKTLGDVQNASVPVGDRLAAWDVAKRYIVQKSGGATTATSGNANPAASNVTPKGNTFSIIGQ